MKLGWRQRLGLMVSEVKSATMRFAMGIRWSMSYRSGTIDDIDYAKSVGDGRGSTLIMACVNVIAIAFLEPRLMVVSTSKDGKEEEIVGHPLTKLLRRPNPYYSGLLMWQATVLDWLLTGNAYWIKVRDGSGLLLELWWIPSWMIEPRWPAGEDGDFLTHYEYQPNGARVPTRYDPSDIVHFRQGIDPENSRKGFSPLRSLLRLVFTDEEAMKWTAAILSNGGSPSIVLSPVTGSKISDPDRVKAEFESRSSGANRGRPMVMSGPIEINTVGYTPSDMALDKLQRVSEERASAIFGTPAVIVGFGAGLDRSTYNNMSEAREHLYESTIIPKHNFFREELWFQLVPEFGDPDAIDLRWDYTKVRVLQDDRDKLYTRVSLAWVNGLISQNEARIDLGYATTDTGDVYAVPGKVKIVTIDELDKMPEPLALPAPTDPNVDPALDPMGDPMLNADGEPVDSNGDPLPAKAAKDYPIGERKAADIASYFSLAMLMHKEDMTRDLASYLSTQRDEVVQRYRDSAKSREYKVSVGYLLPFNPSVRSLNQVLTKWYTTIGNDVHMVTQDELNSIFMLPKEEMDDYIRDSGVYIKGITRTTRNDIAKILRTSLRDKLSVEETAKAIEDAACFAEERATMVARTELGSAANLAAVVSYENSGLVESVSVFDGDQDAICSAWNGRVVPLGEARSIPRLAHPNCVRSFSPIIFPESRSNRNGTVAAHA